MAIKINNTVVIDDGRGISGTGLTVTSISASGSVGSAGSVLTSTGSAIYWSNGATAVGVASTTVFTSSGTWTKPPRGTYALVTIWGGGGCGSGAGGNGGGGGGCTQRLYMMSELPASPIPITIGAGAASTTGNRAGTGGTSTFGVPGPVGVLTAYAGFNGSTPPLLGGGNGGNGFVSRFTATGSVLAPIFPAGNIYFGGNGAVPSPGAVEALWGVWGGGGGGNIQPGPLPTSAQFHRGAGSIWGGGGGSNGQPPAVFPTVEFDGKSIYGGNGGTPTSRNGQPKGGGGAGGIGATASGSGGDGYCLIQVW